MDSPRPGAAGAFAIGAVAGLAAGSLGIGGGLLLVPMLSLLLGLPLKRAVGTSLLGVIVTAVVAVAVEWRAYPANLHWPQAGLLAAGAAVGAWLGVKVIARTPTPVLARMLAGLLLLGALKMSGLLDGLGGGGPIPATGPAAAALHLVGGLAAGVISSLFGVGGGILAVPLLALLHPDWAFQACRATSLAMIPPTALAGALLHRKLENLDLRLGAALVPGAAAGAVGGVLLANRVPGRALEIAFAALLVVAAVRLMRRKAEAKAKAAS